MNTVLRVNMHTGTVTKEVLKDEYRLLGNRGLVDKVLTDEVDPKSDPMGEENKLVFALGMLAGTGFPTGNRISVGAKSPLTGGIKEANSGGNLGSVLARQGIMMIIVEGRPDDGCWYMLHIDPKGEVRLVNADDYLGLGTYAAVERLRPTHGEKAAIALIGGAGERGYHNPTIQVTDDATGHPSRALARGGIGAVMGSKHLKAIVVDWAEERATVEYADRKRFMNATKAYLTVLGRNQATGGALGLIGTMAGITITGKTGALPVKNFSGERCGVIGSIGAEAFLKTIMRRGGKTGLACQPGCPIRCSNIYNDSHGNYLTSGFEYETIALVGANCNIADLDTIARIERSCDEFGLDTIEIGATIGVCMEAGKLAFGDGAKALALIQEIIDATEFGKILAQGTEVTGKYLGVKRIPTVKGQALPGYDPRNTKGTGVGFATSPMGADHTAGTTSGSTGDTLNVGRAQMSQKVQVVYAAVDNFMCHFAAIPLVGTHKYAIEYIAEAMAGRFGGDWNADKVYGIGLTTLIMEKAFNRAAGFTPQDDRLPQFFYDEASPMTGARFDVTDEELAQVLPF